MLLLLLLVEGRVQAGRAASASAARHVRLVMGPHCVLDAGVGVVGVSHRGVAVAVARLVAGGHGRDDSGRRVPVMEDGRRDADCSGGGGSVCVILVVAVRHGSRLRRGLLLRLLLMLLLLLLLLLRLRRRCSTGSRSGHLLWRHLRVAAIVIVAARGTVGRVVVLLPVGIHCLISRGAQGGRQLPTLRSRRRA